MYRQTGLGKYVTKDLDQTVPGILMRSSNTELCYIQTLPVLVAQSVGCLLWGMGGHGFDSRLRHTKVIKLVLAAPRLALRLKGRARTGQDNVTGCGIMSSVCGMILQ